MTARSSFFANPEGLPLREAAQRGGFTYGSFRNLCSRFRKAESADILLPAPKPDPPADPRPERIVALRKQYQASIDPIIDLLLEGRGPYRPSGLGPQRLQARRHGASAPPSSAACGRSGRSRPTAGRWI